MSCTFYSSFNDFCDFFISVLFFCLFLFTFLICELSFKVLHFFLLQHVIRIFLVFLFYSLRTFVYLFPYFNLPFCTSKASYRPIFCTETFPLSHLSDVRKAYDSLPFMFFCVTHQLTYYKGCVILPYCWIFLPLHSFSFSSLSCISTYLLFVPLTCRFNSLLVTRPVYYLLVYHPRTF